MIEEIFYELKGLGAVRTTDEFSTLWLGREKSYLRCLRAKRRDPSSTALATCAVRLLRSADKLNKGQVLPTSHQGTRFRSLANKCLEGILTIGSRP